MALVLMRWLFKKLLSGNYSLHGYPWHCHGDAWHSHGDAWHSHGDTRRSHGDTRRSIDRCPVMYRMAVAGTSAGPPRTATHRDKRHNRLPIGKRREWHRLRRNG